MFDSSSLDSWTRNAFSPELTELEKKLRDKFVTEYLHDFDPLAAAIRVGFQKSFAEDYANKFMAETYVQQQIKQQQTDQGLDTDDARDRQRVKATLRREMQLGSPSSRVAAAAQMAKLLGMEAPTKTETKLSVDSPVQFYLPHNGRDNFQGVMT